tara:strand:+ start:669 stop:3179 length:2511 start_codon:yes stop_codon:yes gene_type:complete
MRRSIGEQSADMLAKTTPKSFEETAQQGKLDSSVSKQGAEIPPALKAGKESRSQTVPRAAGLGLIVPIGIDARNSWTEHREDSCEASRMPSKFIPLGLSATGVDNTQWFDKLRCAADRGDVVCALDALRNLNRLVVNTTSPARSLTFFNLALRACKRCRPPAYLEARRLLLHMRDHGICPDQSTYHEVLAALARAHEWRLAERTFAEMKRELPHVRPSLRIYTSLISAYGKGGQWAKAKLVFEALHEERYEVDTGVYNALLNAALNAAHYNEVYSIFKSMPARGIQHNVTTYNTLLTSHGRQRRLHDMEAAWREMRRIRVEPNETTFSVLITAYGNAEQSDRANQLLDEACKISTLDTSALIFNSALGANVKSGKMKSALRILRQMQQQGIDPTIVTYNTLLMGASAERNWADVARLFREILRRRLIPDAITLDCLCGIEKLQAAADSRAASEAAAANVVRDPMYDASCKKSLIPKLSTSNCSNELSPDEPLGELPNLLRVVLDEELERSYQLLQKPELTPSQGQQQADEENNPPEFSSARSLTYCYDALIRVLHISGQGARLDATFAEMVSKDIRRTVHTYNSLIASFEARRQWQRAGAAMHRMQKEGILADALTFDALIDVCEETGQWDRATAWLEQAQEQGHLRCEDELGVLDLHRVRSAGTAQTVLRWWLRRMRSRALAPLDVRAAGQGTRVILENAARGSRFHEDERSDRFDAHVSPRLSVPIQIRDLPEKIQVITGWGKHSNVFGYSPVKERVIALLDGLNSPFEVPDHNIGCVTADRGEVRAWLVKDEMLSLVRFLGGNKDALRRNFNPLSVGKRRGKQTSCSDMYRGH